MGEEGPGKQTVAFLGASGRARVVIFFFFFFGAKKKPDEAHGATRRILACTLGQPDPHLWLIMVGIARWLFYPLKLEDGPRRWFSTLGSPDAHGAQLPGILACTAGGEGILGFFF